MSEQTSVTKPVLPGDSTGAPGLAALLRTAGAQRLLGMALLTALLIALIYSSGREAPLQEELPPPPALDIESVVKVRAQGDEWIWGRFSADCWVRLKRGQRVLLDQLFVAGQTLSFKPGSADDVPDSLYLGNEAAAQILFRGKPLQLDSAVRRDSVALIVLPTVLPASASGSQRSSFQ